tara:strand:+ start:134 stop:307 length:174 start_codon:yes stop_codon:yes gene_type:complete
MKNKSTNSNNARNLIGICIAVVSAWLFVNLSPWIAAGFAVSAALTWRTTKGQKDLKK